MRSRIRDLPGIRVSLRVAVVGFALAVATLLTASATIGPPGTANALNLCQIDHCATVDLVASGNGSGIMTSADGDFNCTYAGATLTGTCSVKYDWAASAPQIQISITATPSVGSQICVYPACRAEGVSVTMGLDQGPTSTPVDVGFGFDLAKRALTVTRTGDGTGSVTSNVGGISCGATCSASLDYGTPITLTASPDAGAVFSAWTGACNGQGATCTLTLTTDVTTNAVFGLPMPSPSPTPSPSPSPSPSPTPAPAAGPTVGVPQLLLLGPGPVSATSLPGKVRWSLVNSGSPVVAYQLQVRKNGGSWTEVGLSGPVALTANAVLPIGASVQFRVRAGDSAGHTGPWTTGPSETVLAYQETSSAITYTGTWTTTSSSSDWAGHLKAASHASSSATFHFSGRAVGLVTAVGPSEGSVQLYVDGVLVKTISLHSTSTKVRQVVFTRLWSSPGSHILRLVVVGTSGHPAVDLDGFAVLH